MLHVSKAGSLEQKDVLLTQISCQARYLVHLDTPIPNWFFLENKKLLMLLYHLHTINKIILLFFVFKLTHLTLWCFFLLFFLLLIFFNLIFQIHIQLPVLPRSSCMLVRFMLALFKCLYIIIVKPSVQSNISQL